MWKAFKTAFVLVPAALVLMSFDVNKEENDPERMPARAMFGDYGDAPDKAALKEWVMQLMSCQPVATADGRTDIFPMACRFYRLGDFTPASAGPLRVIPLGQKPVNGYLGLRCYESDFGDLRNDKGEVLKDMGLRYSQFCLANGWAYELSMEFYYGMET